MARQCQVGCLVGPPMLFGDDVLHVVGKLAVLLPGPAVLATIDCAPPYQLPSAGLPSGQIKRTSAGGP